MESDNITDIQVLVHHMKTDIKTGGLNNKVTVI